MLWEIHTYWINWDWHWYEIPLIFRCLSSRLNTGLDAFYWDWTLVRCLPYSWVIKINTFHAKLASLTNFNRSTFSRVATHVGPFIDRLNCVTVENTASNWTNQDPNSLERIYANRVSSCFEQHNQKKKEEKNRNAFVFIFMVSVKCKIVSIYTKIHVVHWKP